MTTTRPALHLAAMIALGTTVAVTPAWASERKLHSHEHGVSSLKMAQEGTVVTMELEAPGNDIVGFEYKPKSEAEKKAVEAALTTFKAPDKLFSMSSSAGCALAKSDAEFEAEGDHAGFHVKWSMNCETVAKANAMEITFFDAFPNAKEVEVEAVGPKGQMSAEVEKGTSTVDLSAAFGG